MSRRRRDRAGKQKALISAATSLFARRGYEATTTREIAAHAGCAEGLIHRYFGGKSGLLSTVVNLHFSEETTAARESPPVCNLGGRNPATDGTSNSTISGKSVSSFVSPSHAPSFNATRLGELLGKAVSGRRIVIAQRLRRYEQCRLADEKDIEVLAHALMALSFNFGFH